MNRLKLFSIISLLSLLLVSCLDPYSPPTSSKELDYIVIDGNINSTSNEITVTISRAVRLSDPTNPIPIENATVRVEDSKGAASTLSHSQSGLYKLNLSFDLTEKYRLVIALPDNKFYQSEYIKLNKDSEIDSISYSIQSDGLEIYANTHDFSDGKKYYQYFFEETFEYGPQFYSSWIIANGQVEYRPSDQEISTCWLTKNSSNIILATTEGLEENIILNKQVLKIPKGDRRLWKKYSVNILQKKLDKDAYNYWKQIQKNSESLGGLFDPIPYPVQGNIRSLNNPDEVVLGYFSGGSVGYSRLTISNAKLPSGFSGTLQSTCQESYVPVSNLNSILNSSILLTQAQYQGLDIIGYYYSSPACVDCRLEGGTNMRPPFMN